MANALTSTAPTGTDAATAAAAKERVVLSKLLRTYQTDINKGQTADQLRSLAKQINDAAKQLGQKVSLPKATAATGPAPKPADRPVDTSKVDVNA